MNAVVIGGSKGVGLAISNQFARVYENICIVSRSKENLDKAATSISEVKSKIISYQGDIAEKDFSSKFANHLESIKFGNVDVLICNAGGPPQKLFIETSETDWESVIETSLLGQIRIVREFIPEMVKNNYGRVIFISSTVAKEPSPAMVLSATARSGLSAFVKSVSTEFAKFNITMNVVCLGGVLTDRLESLIADTAHKQNMDQSDVRANLVKGIPIGRFATPKEIADFVSFLASEKASYITGTSIPIDGGLTKGFF